MEKEQTFEIGKLEAAHRQLTTASQLFFDDGDIVSIHMLASAGYEVLADIGSSMSPSIILLREQAAELVKPAFKKEFMKIAYTPQNFFKHADRDPDPNGKVRFASIVAEMTLSAACSAYFKISGKANNPCAMEDFWLDVYNVWFGTYRSKYIVQSASQKQSGDELRAVIPETEKGVFIDIAMKSDKYKGVKVS